MSNKPDKNLNSLNQYFEFNMHKCSQQQRLPLPELQGLCGRWIESDLTAAQCEVATSAICIYFLNAASLHKIYISYVSTTWRLM